MMEKIEQIREQLPEVIGLPLYNPDRRNFSLDDLEFENVTGPSDLPPYLILGTLSEGGFENTENGWRARWGEVQAGTYFEIDFNQPKEHAFIRQFWCGVDGPLTIAPLRCHLGQLIGQLYLQFPGTWDEAASKNLEHRLRIKYVHFQEGMTSLCGIPDGAMKTLCIPLGIGDLRSFILDWAKAITEESFEFPITGYIRKVMGTVNYVEGKNPEWASDKSELLRKTIETAGFVPFHGPIVEHAEDGSSAITVRRLMYLTFITVPFAGLLTLIEALKKAGWILDRHDGHLDDTPKDGIEFTPFVAPESIALETANVTFFDETGVRRAFWVMPENKENVIHDMMSSAETNTEDAIQLASKAEVLGIQSFRILAEKC